MSPNRPFGRARASRAPRVLLLGAVLAVALAATPPPARAAADAQLAAATTAAVGYFRQNQGQSGVIGCKPQASSCNANPFGGDWALLGLAGAGVHAADLRLPSAPGEAAKPSAQDYFYGLWNGTAEGFGNLPGSTGQASDFARTTIMSGAAGIDPSRLAARQNLVAELARYFQANTGYFDDGKLLNQLTFAVIALRLTTFDDSPGGRNFLRYLEQLIVAEQASSGSYSASPDLQGSALFALCEGGRTLSDPGVSSGVANLLARRSGNGFGNVSTNNWVLAGLSRCGLARGAAGWAEHNLEPVVDGLLTRQIVTHADPASIGGVALTATGPANLYESQAFLAGIALRSFTASPPPRLDAADPALRPTPAVEPGAAIRVPLLIDFGTGSFQFCRTDTTAGATVAAALTAAVVAARPITCVADPQFVDGQLRSLGGHLAEPGGWKVSIDGAPEAAAAAQTIGFGDTIALRLAVSLAEPKPGSEPGVGTEPDGVPDPSPQPPGPAEPGSSGGSATGALIAPLAPPRAAFRDPQRITVVCRRRAQGRSIRCVVHGVPGKPLSVRVAAGGRSRTRKGVGGVAVVLDRGAGRTFGRDQRVNVRVFAGGVTRTVTLRGNRSATALL